jgi:hypothetical protein
MDYKAYSEEISKMVRPQTFPIRVKIVKDNDNLPAGSVRPSKYGIKISLFRQAIVNRFWTA